MAKIARISFSLNVLANKQLDTFLLKDILMALPSDTKIIGMNTDCSTATSEILVESSQFVDTPSTSVKPEIVPYFSTATSPAGNITYLSKLDLSAAMPQTVASKPTCNCGTCLSCWTNNAPLPTLQPVSPPPSSGGFPFWFPPGFTAYIPIDLGTVKNFCTHPSRKTYDSGWSRYDYCVHCGEKIV